VGKRSAKALSIMKKEGFKHVYDLEGGLTEWKKKGYNVTSAKLN
jgi:rhodanese-related sulfurtransferase